MVSGCVADSDLSVNINKKDNSNCESWSIMVTTILTREASRLSMFVISEHSDSCVYSNHVEGT